MGAREWPRAQRRVLALMLTAISLLSCVSCAGSGQEWWREKPEMHPRATVCIEGTNVTRPRWFFRDYVQWTSDGSTIFFTDGPAIYAVTADRSQLWQVVERPDPGAGGPIGFIAPFALSPYGDGLYYVTCRYPDPYLVTLREAAGEPVERKDYRHELAWVRVDGTQHHRLTINSDFETDPVWSPDGARIAFIYREYEEGIAFFFSFKPFGLYTMAPDGSEMAQLQGVTPDPSVSPRWSPDSTLLVYGEFEGRSEGVWLYTVAADGAAPPQRLTGAVSNASWSPDGQRIAFAKPDGNEVALYTIAADGSDAQRVTTISGWHTEYGESDPTQAWIETVVWSPDGSKILYSCGGVCVVTPAGSQVSKAPLPGVAAAWSPDGSRIALLEARGTLSTSAPDGSDVRALALQDAERGFRLQKP